MPHSVVILGATGLLGQALTAACNRRGWASSGLSRSTGVDLTALASPAALSSIITALAPTLVINAAAITRLDLCEQQAQTAWLLHARLPGLLTDWSAQTGIPWLQVSTDHYFYDTANTLHDECAPVTLLNEYARTKYAGEQLALTSPQALVVRTNIVGRRGWATQPSFAEWVVQALRAGQPITAYTDVWASSMAAGQCADALLDLSETRARGLVNLAARESISKADFIIALAGALDLDATQVRPQPRPIETLARANAMGLDVRRAESILGRSLPDTHEVAAALARVFKENPHDTP